MKYFFLFLTCTKQKIVAPLDQTRVHHQSICPPSQRTKSSPWCCAILGLLCTQQKKMARPHTDGMYFPTPRRIFPRWSTSLQLNRWPMLHQRGSQDFTKQKKCSYFIRMQQLVVDCNYLRDVVGMRCPKNVRKNVRKIVRQMFEIYDK